jgi:anaerobic magnesium-protoporphyrin IX monomethyl ester cyclase
MPQVLVINPPNSSSVMDTVACTVTHPDELTDWANVPSLGALTLASALTGIPGITPVYLDGTVVPWPELLAYIAENAGDIFAVGVSVLTASYEAGLQLLEHVKQVQPRAWTILGNDHFTALAETCLTHRRDCVDYGFVGNEVVGPFRALIGDLYRDQLRSPAAYPGLAAWDGDRVVLTPQQPEPVFTGQRYELIDAVFPHSEYYTRNFRARVGPRMRELMGADVSRGVPVEFARGCIKFSRDDACTFCSIQYGGMWRNSLESPAHAWDMLRRATRAGYDYLSVTADELPLTFGSLLREMARTRPAWWTAASGSERPLLAGYARADGLANPRHAAVLRDLNIRYLMVGLDAGAPLSLAALNKPLAPARDTDPRRRAERMFQHNIAALHAAREEGLFLKAGFVVGHLGMTPDLLKLNTEAMCTLIDNGKDALASVDIEVLSPEPGSRDYQYLTRPALAADAAARLGLTIADDDIRHRVARDHASLDVIDREQAMSDYALALMPGLTLDDVAAARATVRAHARAAGILVGE